MGAELEERGIWKRAGDRVATGLAEGLVVTLEQGKVTLDQRKVTREMGEAVWENLPLVLEALSDFADKGRVTALAQLAAVADSPDQEEQVRQESAAADLLNDAREARHLRQWLLEAGRRLSDERVADLI
ncbi:hypothetical protein GCM10009759_77050 [Kitasatospora saccharophila]|uniref:Uncharacterized protein n=1 Tax=Kitasatospora saccharophila TaxID=407973 RepID=A0ABN2YCW2_9ACTN